MLETQNNNTVAKQEIKGTSELTRSKEEGRGKRGQQTVSRRERSLSPFCALIDSINSLGGYLRGLPLVLRMTRELGSIGSEEEEEDEGEDVPKICETDRRFLLLLPPPPPPLRENVSSLSSLSLEWPRG